MEPRSRIELDSPIYKTGASPAMLTRRNGANAGNRTQVSCLPCKGSTTELRRLEPDDGYDPSPDVERVAGNDPASSVWKTEALPLDDTRLH